MSTTSNQFFVILPSNTSGYQDNRPNRYRVHLPRSLEFSGNWVVGLHSISYDYSWNNLGTLNEQWLKFHLTNGQYVKLNIPDSSYNKVEDIEKGLHLAMVNELEKKLNERDQILEEGGRAKRGIIFTPIDPPLAQTIDPIEPPEITAADPPR